MTQSIKNLVAAFLISISFFILWVKVVPLYYTTGELKENIEIKKSVISNRLEIIQKIEELINKKNLLSIELQRLSLVTPSEDELAEIISTMENIYLKSGVILTEFQITKQANNQREPLNKIETKINATGSYANLLTLLSLLEKNIRLVDISLLGIAANSSTNQLELDIRGNVYSVNEDQEPLDGSATPVISNQQD